MLFLQGLTLYYTVGQITKNLLIRSHGARQKKIMNKDSLYDYLFSLPGICIIFWHFIARQQHNCTAVTEKQRFHSLTLFNTTHLFSTSGVNDLNNDPTGFKYLELTTSQLELIKRWMRGQMSSSIFSQVQLPSIQHFSGFTVSVLLCVPV